MKYCGKLIFCVVSIRQSGATMANDNKKDPLEGVTLETIVTKLYEHYGWDELSSKITIRCFYNNPGIKSSLTFLRKTPWARKKVETLYIETFAGK